jgi:hypothetical protein
MNGTPEFIIRIRKMALPANSAEDFLRDAKVDVIGRKEKKVILRDISIIDMVKKLGKGPLV